MKITTKKINALQVYDENTAILDITTTGRYWRTSQIDHIVLIQLPMKQGEEIARELIFERETEADEYEMLLQLTKELSNVETIITYNGNSFDIPHLKNKYKAYGLEDPFHQKEYRDLYLEYKKWYRILGLPSRKLRDFGEYLNLDVNQNDAELTLGILCLDAFDDLFEGKWALKSAKKDEDHLYYELTTNTKFPSRVSFHDEIYHLILEGNSAYLSVQLVDGLLRRYYTDVKNYVYLPLEGYAIHKTMAGLVAKEHKEKAVRENCFSVSTYSDLYVTDETRIRNYLITALLFLQSR